MASEIKKSEKPRSSPFVGGFDGRGALAGRPWIRGEMVEPGAWRAPGSTALRSAWWPCLHSIRVPTPVENEGPTGDHRQPQADGVSGQNHLRLHVVVIRSGAGDARPGYPVVRSWRGPATPGCG
jgi:hypothetical protein